MRTAQNSGLRTAALVGIYIALLGISVQLFMINRALQHVERPAAVAMQKEHNI